MWTVSLRSNERPRHLTKDDRWKVPLLFSHIYLSFWRPTCGQLNITRNTYSSISQIYLLFTNQKRLDQSEISHFVKQMQNDHSWPDGIILRNADARPVSCAWDKRGHLQWQTSTTPYHTTAPSNQESSSEGMHLYCHILLDHPWRARVRLAKEHPFIGPSVSSNLSPHIILQSVEYTIRKLHRG